MVSKYNKTFEIPKEFPSILKAFTREVLRNQPNNIYEFGASYFAEVLSQRADDHAQSKGASRLTPSELEDLLVTMFERADKDGSGSLSIAEFKEALKMANLGLTNAELTRVMAEADVNHDGEITYAEFVPLAIDVVMSFYARVEKDTAIDHEEREARERAHSFMLHGMSKEELEGVMRDVFQKADADGSGALSLSEFHKCIKEADLGLTRKEINRLMQEIDADRDGCVTYEEFVPICFDLLVELLKDELLESREANELEEHLMSVLARGDSKETGRLSVQELRDLLRSADLGLTRLQIHTILAEAEYDDNGMTDYAAFVPPAAKMIHSMLDVETQLERRQTIGMLTESFAHNGKGEEQVEAALMEAFSAADTDGTGFLEYAKMRHCLENSGIEMTPKEVMAVLSSVSDDTPYRDVAAFAFKILKSVATTAM